ncbi:MAG: hypothetical protein ACI35W_06980 [Anaeroplasmataceae bacterium]
MKRIKCTLAVLMLLMVYFTMSNTYAVTGSTFITVSYNNSSYDVFMDYDDSLFGHASYVSCGTYDTVKKLKNTNYINDYYNLTKYVYMIYKYDTILNARVCQFSPVYYYVDAGNSKTISLTLESEVSSTYEVSVSNSISACVSSSYKEVVGDITFGVSSGATSTVSTVVKNSKTYSYSKSLTISDTLYGGELGKYYSWESRADFNVYYSCLYEISYDSEKTVHKTWYGKKYSTYTYTIASIDLVDSMYSYSIIDNSEAQGFFPYKRTSSSGYEYAAEKIEGITYLD